MVSRSKVHLCLFSFLVLFVRVEPARAAGVRVKFNPSDPEIGPFPTDYLTAPATNTRTARRVRLPQPVDCAARPNDCQEIFLLNQLDGFHVQARVRISFSGAIDPATAPGGVFFVARELLAEGERGVHQAGEIIRLNQIVYDSVSNTLYGKPDRAMDQSRRYLLVVTDAVRDAVGDAVEAEEAFTACLETAPDEYCKALAEALKAVPTDRKIVAASLYTTMSVTAWLERARDRLADVAAVATAHPGQSFFPLVELRSIRWLQQVRTSGEQFSELTFPLLFLQGIRGIYFGSYASPNYLEFGRVIEPVASLAPLAPAPAVSEIHFHAFLPSGAKPPKGYPVVIFGHGLGDSRFGAPSLLASTFAADGMATVAISAVGHGGGPGGMLAIQTATGAFSLAAPGRGVDLNNDGRIDPAEGCAALLSAPFGLRDCLRQTVVDLMQLVRLLRAGLDVDGDGQPDFDPDRIYYAGQSLGAIYGTMLLAVDPHVKFGVLNAGGGSLVEISRWSRAFQSTAAANLALRSPPLVFRDNYVLRNQPVKVISDPTSIQTQNVLETLEWIQAEGDPFTYAVHLKPSPLAGVPEKRVLWQFPWGDQTVPNPTQSALVRHADMRQSTWVYRNDKARAVSRFLNANPHGYLTDTSLAGSAIAFRVQQQMSSFLASEGANVLNPNSGLSFLFGGVGDLFEQPETLPEELNYLEE
ncbi:MAG: Ig-like domain-containing protein [Bryobacteraceae bacterium]|nr:Ig-like domain-containing protein [Bryobacteraceae bacterium]MDW8377304.1 hypothetical protein [Bryobacterales bacterium]